MADGISLERRGLPTAVVCTDAFDGSAGAMAQVQGFPAYDYVRTRHPVAVLTPDEVRERAREALHEVTAILLGGSKEQGAA